MSASVGASLVDQWIVGAPAATETWPGRPFEPIAEAVILTEALGPLRRFVETRPGDVVVDDGVRQLTYGQFWRAVQALAAKIKTVAAPGQALLAITRNDVFFPVMLFGAHLAGRPITVLDLSSPPERQTLIVEEMKGSVGLVPENTGLNAGYLSAATPRIEVELDPATAVVAVDRRLDPDEIMIIFFTSGSTGRPKGWAAPSWSMQKHIHSCINQLQVGGDDVVLSLGSPSTLGIRDALIAVLGGARLRLLDLRQAGMLEALRVLREDRVTILGLVPSVIRSLMQVPGADGAFETMRVLGLVGEPMSGGDVALFRSKIPPRCRISFALASTEGGQVFHWLVRDEEMTGPQVPLGYLVEGRRIALVDEGGEPVQPGEVGELVISDAYVGLGDWRAGGVDPSRVRIDPGSGHRTYATGDLIRMRAEGLYEFAGRRDRMVKIHGLRADLGEIETVLKGIPGVAEAVVIAQEGKNGYTTLIGFITVAAGSTVDNIEVRRRLAEGTAPHMVPTAIHRLAEIPRLHNGKVDLVRLKSFSQEAR